MKWENSGSELESRGKEITKEFSTRKNIFLFGAGKIGNEKKAILKRYNVFAGFIDNDPWKQENGYLGERVCSLDELDGMKGEAWIVVTASKNNKYLIEMQLDEKGYVDGKDYFYWKDFFRDTFPILSYYFFNKLFVYQAQICVTERCTLHCKKCAHACNKVDIQSRDMELDVAKKSADFFFRFVDIVQEFVLIGGEPFLYKNLEEVAEYIGNRYRDKIQIYSITTNGTILPSDRMIELCKKYRITIRVSDYSGTNPKLKPLYESFYRKARETELIVWSTNAEESWYDYGFGEFRRRDDPKTLIDAFDRCHTECREIRGSRYYYCVMARSVSDNLGLNIGEKDYLELDGLNDKAIFFEFEQGYSQKGYLSFCAHCRGADAEQFLIPAAEQES